MAPPPPTHHTPRRPRSHTHSAASNFFGTRPLRSPSASRNTPSMRRHSPQASVSTSSPYDDLSSELPMADLIPVLSNTEHISPKTARDLLARLTGPNEREKEELPVLDVLLPIFSNLVRSTVKGVSTLGMKCIAAYVTARNQEEKEENVGPQGILSILNKVWLFKIIKKVPFDLDREAMNARLDTIFALFVDEDGRGEDTRHLGVVDYCMMLFEEVLVREDAVKLEEQAEDLSRIASLIEALLARIRDDESADLNVEAFYAQRVRNVCIDSFSANGGKSALQSPSEKTLSSVPIIGHPSPPMHLSSNVRSQSQKLFTHRRHVSSSTTTTTTTPLPSTSSSSSSSVTVSVASTATLTHTHTYTGGAGGVHAQPSVKPSFISVQSHHNSTTASSSSPSTSARPLFSSPNNRMPSFASFMNSSELALILALARIYINHIRSPRLYPYAIINNNWLERVFPTLFVIQARIMKVLPRLGIEDGKGKEKDGARGEFQEMLEDFVKLWCRNTARRSEMEDLLLKLSFPPNELPPSTLSILTTLGSLRIIRTLLRNSLSERLRSRYIRNLASNTNHSGVMNLSESDLNIMNQHWAAKREKRAKAKPEEEDDWDWQVSWLREWLASATKAWVDVIDGEDESAEKVLEEVLDLCKDLVHFQGEMKEHDMDDDSEGLGDHRSEDGDDLDDESEIEDAKAVAGEIVRAAVEFVKSVRNEDGSPYILPLDRPNEARKPVLNRLCVLFDPTSSSSGHIQGLANTALLIITHLSDAHTERLPDELGLMPDEERWKNNWVELFQNVFGSNRENTGARVNTREKLWERVASVWEALVDWDEWRMELADLVHIWWKKCVEESAGFEHSTCLAENGEETVWNMLRKEIVVRVTENGNWETDETASGSKNFEMDVLNFMLKTATECSCEAEREEQSTPLHLSSVFGSPSSPPATGNGTNPPSTINSPVVSRIQSGHAQSRSSSERRERDPSNAAPILISHILGGRGTANNPHPDIEWSTQTPPETPNRSRPPIQRMSAGPEADQTQCHGVLAISSVINLFSSFAFTPQQSSLRSHRIFKLILDTLNSSTCTRTRLVILQFLMRLRSERDHRVYLVGNIDADISELADRLDFVAGEGNKIIETPSEDIGGVSSSRARSRNISRGRGGPRNSASRSRSRAPQAMPTTPLSLPRKAKVQLWSVPEHVTFETPEQQKDDGDILWVQPSRVVLTYQDPKLEGADPNIEQLLVSDYVDALWKILETEKEWDVLAYVIIHLPIQLANKHFFCGPRTKESMWVLLTKLSIGLAEDKLGDCIQYFPEKFRARDLRSLGYHVLTVLVSYRDMFEPRQREGMVTLFLQGLREGIGATMICCVSGLTLCSHELRDQVSRHLLEILEQLERLMSNAGIAVHVLAFLSIVGSQPTLYANFTDEDYKRVFSIALKYLETHNDAQANANLSFALTQHVLVMTFNVLYTWFLAIPVQHRPPYVPYITRQVLLANNGKLNEASEVCFDWLARYTYASVDPKPAPSVLRDTVLGINDAQDNSLNADEQQKWWLLGLSVVGIRARGRRGWMEVEVRRASGMTRLLCHIENHPFVPLGDVEPDNVSIPAANMGNRIPAKMRPIQERLVESDAHQETVNALLSGNATARVEDKPDSTTGYVWSGTAPSQRRKEVTISPSFFGIQLSPYPNPEGATRSIPISTLPDLMRTINVLDRVPVLDTHDVGVLYVAPGQTQQTEILSNEYGSPAYSRFLDRLGRLIKVRGQLDVYTGGLDPDTDGDHTLAFWDDIGQLLFHVATMMPNNKDDPLQIHKQRHIGNDYVKVIWNDSGMPYDFKTIQGDFNFVNIIIEPHSAGIIGAYSSDPHESLYLKVTMQRRENMPDFGPIGQFKIISAENLPRYVRSIAHLSDWFCKVYRETNYDQKREEYVTNWQTRLQSIKRLRARAEKEGLLLSSPDDATDGYNFTVLY